MKSDGTLPYGTDGTSHHGRHAMAECNATQRNATERKSHQDPVENPSVSDAARPVDNSVSGRVGKVDEAEFLTLEHAGMTAREIAERLHVNPRTVVRWRKRLHLDHRPPAETVTPEQRDLARRLIEDGCSFKEAARTVGVSHWTIRRWFPDTPAWTRQQVGEHAALMRRMNRTLERNAA